MILKIIAAIVIALQIWVMGLFVISYSKDDNIVAASAYIVAICVVAVLGGYAMIVM